MNVTDYDKIKLEFEEFSIMLPKNIIQKFEVKEVEQLIEAKYHPETEYEVYLVINRILAEKFWEKEALHKFKRNIRREIMGIFIFTR